MSSNSLAKLSEEPVKKPQTTSTSADIKFTGGNNQSMTVTLPKGINDVPEHVREIMMTYYEKADNVFIPYTTKELD